MAQQRTPRVGDVVTLGDAGVARWRVTTVDGALVCVKGIGHGGSAEYQYRADQVRVIPRP